MDTYAGPDACGATPCNLTTALGKDKAALCTAATGNCSRYMPGLMMGKPGALGNLSASELTATMDWLLDQGVTAISLWAGAHPPSPPPPSFAHVERILGLVAQASLLKPGGQQWAIFSAGISTDTGCQLLPMQQSVHHTRRQQTVCLTSSLPPGLPLLAPRPSS